jgi:hypothetical protein
MSESLDMSLETLDMFLELRDLFLESLDMSHDSDSFVILGTMANNYSENN